MTEISPQVSRSAASGRAAFVPAVAWRGVTLSALFRAVRPGVGLLGIAATLVLLIAAATGGALWHFRDKAVAEAERQTRNLDGVLAEQTARSVEHVDFILSSMVERIESERAAGGSADDGMMPRMRELLSATPQIRTMMITDSAGHMTQSTTGRLTYVGDRPHFIAQREGTPIEPYISAPFVTRLDKKLAISVSRRITGADGAFGGIVATSLDPAYFNDIYRHIDLGRGSAIGLFRDDGICLINFPGDADNGHVPFAHTASAPFLSGTSGVYRDRDTTTGAERIIAFHRVGNLPLLSVVSVTVDAVLADWRREVRLFSSGAVVVAVTLCLLIYLLGKELKRRDALTEALRANEERFRNFAEASSDWFWEQDADLRFTYLSNAVFTKSGLAPADHIGKTRQEVVHRGVTAEQWRQHQADLDARRPFRDFRFQRVDLDGSVRYISIGGTPVFDGDGRFRGYAGNARDITPQILAEKALHEAKAEAEAAARTKGEFLAVISHELRTPLNAIIGFSDLICRQILGPIGNAKYQEYAGDILDAGRHLLGLINNILDMSKIEARKMELTEEPVDLGAIADSCMKIVERQAADGRIALTSRIPLNLPQVRADEMRLKQILLNLLSNAVKFTPAHGRVTLSAHLDASGALVIEVSDTGIGMNEDEISVALQPFRQIESAVARKHEGTGLGLPLVKAFTELHGGTLAFTSRRGAGTTARIVLPASRVLQREVALA
jgi:PAS domain S-box-containing protein